MPVRKWISSDRGVLPCFFLITTHFWLSGPTWPECNFFGPGCSPLFFLSQHIIGYPDRHYRPNRTCRSGIESSDRHDRPKRKTWPEMNFFGPGCSPLFFFYHNTFLVIRTDIIGLTGHAGAELNLRTDMIGLTGHAGPELNLRTDIIGQSPIYQINNVM